MSVIVWAQFWMMAFAAGVAIVREHWLDVIGDQAVTAGAVPDEQEQQAGTGPRAQAESMRAAVLPFTPQLRTSPPQLRQPRVCAGRAAFLQAVTTVRDTEGWPVASYANGHRWPLQEGTA